MIKKIIVKYGRFIEGEYYEKEKRFDKWQDSFEYMSSLDNVYSFKITLIRDNKK